MSTFGDMYPVGQAQPQFPLEQQLPSTSYGGDYNASAAPPYPYRSQTPNYYQPNYNMGVPYPQGQQAAVNNRMPQSEAGPTFTARLQMDRKMLSTQEWMRTHRFLNNGVQDHSRPSSVAPSVMSRFTHMSVATDVSTQSVHSLLSDVQRLEQLRISHSTVPSSSSSCVENIDPNRKLEYEHTVTACLDNICNIIQESIPTNDKAALRSAVDNLFIIAKNSDFNVASEASLEALMRKLVDLMARLEPQKLDAEYSAIMEKILRAVSGMLSYEKVKKLLTKWDINSLISTFVPWIVPTERLCLFALLTIHSLMEMGDPRKFARNIKETAIVKLVHVLEMMYQKRGSYFIRGPKQKQGVFVLIRSVFTGDEGLKSLFVSNRGMQLLLQLLIHEDNELPIFRIIQVLYALVSTPNKTFGLHFNNYKGLEAVCCAAAKCPPGNRRVVEYALLTFRAVSDIEEIRASDNRTTIDHVVAVMGQHMGVIFNLDNRIRDYFDRFQYCSYILSITVEFLGNIAAGGHGIRNENKDYIVGRGIVIQRLVALLDFYRRARSTWKDVKDIEHFIVQIIWALKTFTGACLTVELTYKASRDLMGTGGASEMLLQELAVTMDLNCRGDLLNILLRIVDADRTLHPQLLCSALNNTSLSFTNILLDIIATTINIQEPNIKALGKQIVSKAYALLLLVGNSKVILGNEIRWTCTHTHYQMADFLWSVVDDSDLMKYALDFIAFIAKEEQYRDLLSKDMNLIRALQQLVEQFNENAAAAQTLLCNLTCSEVMIFDMM